MFDRTDDYEEKIKPILKELNRMCVICGIPYFAAFCVKDMDGKTSYRNVLYSASNMSTVLSDDQLCKHINVANGFDTVLHQPELDFSVFDDLDDPELEILWPECSIPSAYPV